LARGYPGSEHSRYAFGQLVERTCKENPLGKRYVFSSKLLIDLGRNNDLNNGVREFVRASIDQPMVTDDGMTRKLSEYEKTEFLFKTRMYDEALSLLQRQYDVLRHDPSSPELPNLMYGLARTL